MRPVVFPISVGVTLSSPISNAAPRPVPGPIKKLLPLNSVPSFIRDISFSSKAPGYAQ